MSAAPYLLFYAERSKENDFKQKKKEEKYDSDEEMESLDLNSASEASSLDNTVIEDLLPNVAQTQHLDCEGKCKGRRTKHRVFVCEYEASKAFIVHVQRPKHMPLHHIERTLFASEDKDSGGGTAFDLRAMVCRVGMSHYICYRREYLID